MASKKNCCRFSEWRELYIHVPRRGDHLNSSPSGNPVAEQRELSAFSAERARSASSITAPAATSGPTPLRVGAACFASSAKIKCTERLSQVPGRPGARTWAVATPGKVERATAVEAQSLRYRRRVATGIATIALVLSGLSVAIAALSWLTSRQSVAAAKAAIHDARMPSLTLSVETALGGGYVGRLRNNGAGDLDEVIVALVPARQYEGATNVVGVGQFASHSLPSGPRIEIGPLTLGENRDLTLVHTGPYRGGVLRLRCECRRGDEWWPVLVEATLPHSGRP
jgi:hypothetical protein